MSAIKDLKNQLTLANKKFKNAKYEEAIEAYGDIIVDERLSAKEGKEASGDVSSSGKVFDDKFEILFDAHLNRSACRSTIGEWEFAAMDALKCKEMNNISIKAYTRLATAYQGSGDHLACIKECEEGLRLRDSDIALRQIWTNSDRVLHPENYPSEIISPMGHDHSHDHGHSHSHEHQQPNYLSKSSSYESDFMRSERAAGGNGSATLGGTSHLTSSRGVAGRQTPTGTGNERSCMAGIKVICCFS